MAKMSNMSRHCSCVKNDLHGVHRADCYNFQVCVCLGDIFWNALVNESYPKFGLTLGQSAQ